MTLFKTDFLEVKPCLTTHEVAKTAVETRPSKYVLFDSCNYSMGLHSFDCFSATPSLKYRVGTKALPWEKLEKAFQDCQNIELQDVRSITYSSFHLLAFAQ